MNYKNSCEYKNFKQSRFFDYFNELRVIVNKLRKEGVHFYFIQTPVASRIKNLSDFEKKRINDWQFDFNNISNEDCRIIKEIYSKETKIEYIKALYDGAKIYEKNKIKYLADFRSEFVNIIDGKRVTYYQPIDYVHKIYIFGQCTARGTGVEDKQTIASFLQKMINEDYPNIYKVINMAIGCGSDIHDDSAHMKDTSFNRNDIIVLCTNLEIVPMEVFNEVGIKCWDSSYLFNRPHDYGEWFTDMTCHTNAKGNEILSKYIYEIINDEILQTINLKSEQDALKIKDVRNISYVKQDSIDNEMLNDYIYHICNNWRTEGERGCIVMNCNPFTLGHLYLIEKAAMQVDQLCIFVVEENKSFFSFEDRIKLVKQGTKHIKNVHVFPSGKFIISATTFPGYFYKDGNNEIEVDTVKDVNIFAKYIAPRMKIVKRFVGTEPNDYVTRIYNESMKEILPQYNIQLIEIPRKEKDGNVISASLVRQYLKERNFDKIKDLVPETTYKYLVRNYG